MSTCACTRCAVEEHSRLAAELDQPAVVVGGRYVVGANPTYRYRGVRYDDIPDEVVGMTVTVASGADPEGDVLVEAERELSQWLDPRHLTPAPEPAAAPAVDDDLLRDLTRALAVADADGFRAYGFMVRSLLASEPMQRLRAAWTAADSARLLLERDRARDELVDARDRHREVTVELTAERNQAVRERDEARATKDLHKERQQELEAALNTAEEDRDEARFQRDEARAELNRLREAIREACA